MHYDKLGIIAGEGKFPVLIAKEAARKGIEVYAAVAKGNGCEEDFHGCAQKIISLKVGQLNGAIKFFKENGVKTAVMAGRVKHINIFNVMPDLRAAKVLASIKDMRAKSILQAAIDEFTKEGIKFVSSALFLDNFIAKKGVLTKRAPSEIEKQNIELGLHISRTLASLDVGLTSVICDRAVMAVEGMEGTDECIKRAGNIYASAPLGKKSPITVVKVARPNQDDRYDLPVIGKGTIKAMCEAKAKTLACEAQKTIILDIDEVIAQADKNGISIIAV